MPGAWGKEMTNQKPPFSVIATAMKPDLIAFLKTQRRYIRTSDILDEFDKSHPEYLREVSSRKGKASVLGHSLIKIIPVHSRNSRSSYLFDNTYSEI